MSLNPKFLAALGQQVDKESLVLFVCRTGVRSNTAAAAATGAGFLDCYNVLEGFQGEKDTEGHRNTTGGWCAAGLPWVQG